jgi:hypothetical protein
MKETCARRATSRAVVAVLAFEFVAICTAVFATDGHPEAVQWLPLAMLIASWLIILVTGVAAAARRWACAQSLAAMAFCLVVGVVGARTVFYLIAGVGTQLARNPETVETTKMNGSHHGWGWCSYRLQTNGGLTICIRDYYRESGWNFSVQSGTWTRVSGGPFAATLLGRGALNELSALAAAIAVGAFAITRQLRRRMTAPGPPLLTL